jgi:hypothetical protein
MNADGGSDLSGGTIENMLNPWPTHSLPLMFTASPLKNGIFLSDHDAGFEPSLWDARS